MIQLIQSKQLINYLKDPLRKNSVFLIAGNIILGLFGFLFWMLAARFYPVSDVGLTTAVISAANLLVAFSDLGFSVSIVRFLPDERDKAGMVNSCFVIVGLISLVLALCFVAGLNIWSPALLFLRQDAIYLTIFVMLTLFSSLFMLQNSVFIAFRATEFSFIQCLIAGLRILLLALFAGIGALGILSSFGLGFCIAFVAANFFIWKVNPGYRPVPLIRKEKIEDMARFSFGNYIANSFGLLPVYIFPILLVNVTNPEMSAHFYISWMIASVLFRVSYSTASSLLAEVSYSPQEIRHQIVKAARFIFLILVPAILALFFFGNLLLSLFGEEYAREALHLLWILALSSIPVAFNELYVTICRLDKKVKPLICMRAFVALATIGGAYFLLKILGLNGIGIAWIVSNIMTMLIVLPGMLKRAGIFKKG